MAWVSAVILATALLAGVECAQLNEIPQILQKFDIWSLLDNGRALEGTQCGHDLEIYYNGTLALQGWALQMLDSNAKIPEGLLIGNMFFLGQYDECISVSDAAITFTGKHCLPNIYPSTDQQSQTPFSAPVSDAIPLIYHYGICVPSSCTESDLETVLNNTLSLVGLRVELPEGSCKTSELQPLSAGDWVVIVFLIVMVLTVIESTVYEVYQRIYRNNSKPHPLLSAFSVYSNLKNLMTTSSNGQMSCLHGLRALSMAWVVLCHAYLMALSTNVTNFFTVFEMLIDINKTPIVNGFVSVDSFFFLSGLLVCFVFFRDIDKKGGYDVPMGYIHRYLRLTPPFAAMILLQISILRVIGDGPLWDSAYTGMADICKKSWWSGLLYIQNFVDPKSTCLGQSWYLSADMQMYWVAPLLLYPMYLWPKIGTIWLGLVTAAGLSLNFAIAYVNDLGPSSVISRNPEFMGIDYVQFYMRAVPWLVGVALGYLICGLKAKKIEVKLSKLTVLLGWLLSTAVALSSIYSFHVFFDRDYTSLEGAFYLAFSRLAWGLVLAWIVFACLFGYGGPINVFLSWGVFQTLGKLSYSTFLIHMSINLYKIGIARTNMFMTDANVIYDFIGDYVLSNLFAIPFTLMFEMPFANIDRYLFRNAKIIPYPKKTQKVSPRDKKADVEKGRETEKKPSESLETNDNSTFVRDEQ